jgi:hypothetical protein
MYRINRDIEKTLKDYHLLIDDTVEVARRYVGINDYTWIYKWIKYSITLRKNYYTDS